MGWNFPAQSTLRKGAINPANPTQISWSHVTPIPANQAYRSACTFSDNGIHWLGGSIVTYNYNGVAYNGSGGVSPLQRNLMYNPLLGNMSITPIFGDSLPMDLRGVAEFTGYERYIVGGMESGQKVSNKTLKLTFSPASINQIVNTSINVYPNPVTNYFTVLNTDKLPIVKITLHDITGSVVRVFDHDKTSHSLIDLPVGSYFVRIHTEQNGYFTHKIVKK